MFLIYYSSLVIATKVQIKSGRISLSFVCILARLINEWVACLNGCWIGLMKCEKWAANRQIFEQTTFNSLRRVTWMNWPLQCNARSISVRWYFYSSHFGFCFRNRRFVGTFGNFSGDGSEWTISKAFLRFTSSADSGVLDVILSHNSVYFSMHLNRCWYSVYLPNQNIWFILIFVYVFKDKRNDDFDAKYDFHIASTLWYKRNDFSKFLLFLLFILNFNHAFVTNLTKEKKKKEIQN